MFIRLVLVASALAVYATAAAGATSASVGKQMFRLQCMLCHSAESDDSGGAQGPDLHGVFGRAAASDARFAYTPALRDSKLVWDAATLDRFLKSPTSVVPGTAMVVPVPDAAERQALIAYFKALSEEPGKPATARPAASNPTLAPGAAADQPDWQRDHPGRAHRITADQLAAPYATPSTRFSAKVVARPDGAQLSVPAGFKVGIFATDLQGPRTMRIAPDGDIVVAETRSGRIRIMHPSADGTHAASVSTFAQGLNAPFGIQFYPADKPRWLYVAESNRVVRFAYRPGDASAQAAPEVVVPQLHPVAGAGHVTRDIAFSLDGKRMFVSVGSATNVAEDMSKKTLAQAREWEAQHGLGSAWDKETGRAVVLAFELHNGLAGAAKVYATGIRNCVGLTIEPGKGDLWCTTNERDALGDNLVPDYSTRVREGGFYGWPWYYLGQHEDPRHQGERPDLAGKALTPDVLYQAHSAALTLAFYTATAGGSAFPTEFVGDGFTTMHGSWNRAERTGYKVVRMRMKAGVPTGQYDDFLVGFVVDAESVWGRPAGIVVAADGALLVSDDGNSVVYRISRQTGEAK
jgi:glucose/arabinose dehydrogenase/cytochrome c2